MGVTVSILLAHALVVIFKSVVIEKKGTIAARLDWVFIGFFHFRISDIAAVYM